MRNYGFTLIELSIVLIIVGLISAGVLVGRDLIHAAEVRAQVSQIGALDTAVTTFKLKYNCLPGDCLAAQSLGLGPNGNGNEKISPGDYAGTFQPITAETMNFWLHLSTAELINGNYPGWAGIATEGEKVGTLTPPLKLTGKAIDSFAGYPLVPTGGIMVFLADPALTPPWDYFARHNDRHVWWLTASMSKSDTRGRIYTAPDMYALDVKLDDGFPRQGSFVAITDAIDRPDTHFAPGWPDGCVNSSVTPFVYNLKSDAPSVQSLCSPIILTQFK